VQLGEAVNGEKPKRASLLRGMQPADVDLDTALKLLALPRQVGLHPEDGEPIVVSNGRYGPYVQHGKTYANLETGDDLFHIGLNRAVTLIAEKIAKGPKGRRFGSDPGRPLGEHPQKGGPVVVKSGRYGPYVSHDGVNATLPKDKAPETVTLEEALPLLAAREEQIAVGGGRRPSRGKTAKSAKVAAKPVKEAKEARGKTAKAAPKGAQAAEKPAKPAKTAAKKAVPSAKTAATVVPVKTPGKIPTKTASKAVAKPPAKSARAVVKAPARPPAKKPAAETPPKRARAGK
jgi:DNA topoisomerase-1